MKSNIKESLLFDLCDRYDSVKYADSKDILRVLMNDRSPFIRSLLARVAAIYTDDFMHSTLMTLADDRNNLVRVEVADSLSAYEDEAAYQKLMCMTQDPYYLVRGYAVYGVGLTGNTDERREKSLALIRELLPKERLNFNRLSCYQALYFLGEKDELQHILSLYSVQNYKNQCCIINFLMEILSNDNRDGIAAFSDDALRKCRNDSVREALTALFERCKTQIAFSISGSAHRQTEREKLL